MRIESENQSFIPIIANLIDFLLLQRNIAIVLRQAKQQVLSKYRSLSIFAPQKYIEGTISLSD